MSGGVQLPRDSRLGGPKGPPSLFLALLPLIAVIVVVFLVRPVYGVLAVAALVAVALAMLAVWGLVRLAVCIVAATERGRRFQAYLKRPDGGAERDGGGEGKSGPDPR